MAILQGVLGRPVTALDDVPDAAVPVLPETVVFADHVKAVTGVVLEADLEDL